MIRVRFAPSPTGYLHVGGARTALFNWLYARRHGGMFVLRIEDTDVERSSAEMVEGILDGMRWLGLDWDEGPRIGGQYGPYFQSERLERYRATAEQLVAGGHAYYCYCTPDEIKAKREAAEKDTGAWRYDRTCCRLTADEIAEREREHRPRAIRVKAPDRTLRFDDLVHGTIEFEGANLEDFVILRSDGHPTYHLSVVSDDVEMKMTHVVRGDDHISNTPKQLVLYEALGAPVPKFAHVPLILGADKKRLSKRHGATSVMEYARQGYLPEAMVNFLALLGWSPGSGDQEVFTREQLLGGVRPCRHQRRECGLRFSQARLVQPAASVAAATGRARAACQAAAGSGGALAPGLRAGPACVAVRGARAAQAAGEETDRLRRARPLLLRG